jgi:hypothetical protein
MSFAFLIPIAKIALRAVVGEVLSVEKIFGAGKGAEKKDEAVKGVSDTLESQGFSKIADALDEVAALIEAVVEVLNALGMLDDEPGLDVDYNRLIPAAKSVFSAVADLADALA